MFGSAVSFAGNLPGEDLRWVIQTSLGPWLPYVAPTDWSEDDYLAPKRAFRDRDVQTETIYLASTLREKRQVVLKKGECARIGSTKPTPKNILRIASEFGFLGRSPKPRCLTKEESSLLLLDWEEAQSEGFEIYVEPAADWLHIHFVLESLLAAWESGLEGAESEEVMGILDHEWSGGTLALDLKLDPADGRLRSDLIATSFSDALKVQLALLLASDATLKKCVECDGWMVVYPGLGRPDKLYCSRACAMRAHRRRHGAAVT